MRKTGLILFGLLLGISFWMAWDTKGFKSVEEAIAGHHPGPAVILQETKADKGVIVLYTHEGGDDLSFAVLKKTFGHYSVKYSGVQGDLDMVLSRLGFAECYIPAIRGVSSPVYAGLVNDPDITDIRILEKHRDKETTAPITENQGRRIWVLDLEGFSGSQFEIQALTGDKRVVAERTLDLSPARVDQKPYAGY